MSSTWLTKLIPGITYSLRNTTLYCSLTDKVLADYSLLTNRGSSFKMPANSGFRSLSEANVPEPDTETVLNALELAYSNGYETDTNYATEDDLNGITFAGAGDPFTRLDTLCEIISIFKQQRHGVPVTVSTLGLVPAAEAVDIVSKLEASGVEKLSIFLGAENPVKYKKVVGPHGNVGFGDVCNFVVVATEAGIKVTTSAIERKGVNINAIRNLSQSLGADFKARTYHE
tara:strand:- start:126 stop:812 length:687 start_codon:yes stop_codon:yes gene_type:complete